MVQTQIPRLAIARDEGNHPVHHVENDVRDPNSALHDPSAVAEEDNGRRY